MFWFPASPRSSIPSSVGISISHNSSDTETTCTHAYSGGGGFENKWPVSVMSIATPWNLSCFLSYGITNLHGVSYTMSSTGCLAFSIEPALLGAAMVPIWESSKFGRTCPEPLDIAFSAVGPVETYCCMKKPSNSCLMISLILSSRPFL
jgi:hypothetical protein